jgi:hypothetical protein
MGASESKLEFRKQVFALSSSDEIDENDSTWQVFYSIPDNAEEVFNLFPHKEIRSCLLHKNIIKLIRILVMKIQKFTAEDGEDESKKVLNCVRLLTRIIPLIFELDNQDVENEIFWNDDQLGAILSKSVIRLLFRRGFTIPPSNKEEKVEFIIWNKGIGALTAPPASKDELITRIEVLRLLLTLLSKGMYLPGSSNFMENRWVYEIACLQDKKSVLGLLCSLLNTSIDFPYLVCTYDPVGWANLPYNHLLFNDLLEPLVSLCAQTLSVLFDYHPPSEIKYHLNLSSKSTPTENNLSSDLLEDMSPPNESINKFRFYMAKLHKPEDFKVLVVNIMNLLNNPIQVI